jgi:hypothetical protein
MKKVIKNIGCGVSAVVDLLTSNPRTKGSNPAAVTEREKIMKKVKNNGVWYEHNVRSLDP